MWGQPVEVDCDQMETLVEINQHYMVGEGSHIQNIQINKFIGENEKCIFYFMEKIIRLTFLPTQNNLMYF